MFSEAMLGGSLAKIVLVKVETTAPLVDFVGERSDNERVEEGRGDVLS
jgi:hypothetical protein